MKILQRAAINELLLQKNMKELPDGLWRAGLSRAATEYFESARSMMVGYVIQPLIHG